MHKVSPWLRYLHENQRPTKRERKKAIKHHNKPLKTFQPRAELKFFEVREKKEKLYPAQHRENVNRINLCFFYRIASHASPLLRGFTLICMVQ